MQRSGWIRFACRLIEGWALLGGLLLLAVVLLNAWSMGGNIFFGAPLPGDFEMVEIGVAVAAFSFLPYCQITGANVSADIFTSRAGPRTVAALSLLAALIALLFSLLLLWRMHAGMADYQEYEETTAILGFPIWIAFIPILISLALLALAALVSLIEATRALKIPPDPSLPKRGITHQQ
jgi:TRAP-type C4-dicarboxylate transport system permease small subunit